MEICKAETPALEQVGPNHRVACFLVSEQSIGAHKKEPVAAG
jgi:hypothetical protein